jgi:hypothetical protein
MIVDLASRFRALSTNSTTTSATLVCIPYSSSSGTSARVIQWDQDYIDRVYRDGSITTPTLFGEPKEEYPSSPYPAKKVADQAAGAKALALLMSILSKAQQDEYIKEGRVTIKSPSGRLYRVRKGRQLNIEEINFLGIKVCTWCIHPSMVLPPEDNMVSQILTIRFNEELFRRTAVKH